MARIPKDRSKRMQFFGWTCLMLAGKYQVLGMVEAVIRLCNRAEYFFEQAEQAHGGAA